MALTRRDEEMIFRLAEKLTGSCQEGAYRKDIFINNIERRMQATGTGNLGTYLRLVKSDAGEYEKMISGLTIHTTSWFRETPHFGLIKAHVESLLPEGRPIKVWSAACSTGEEVYTIGLSLREFFERAQLEIHGSDLDPVSVRTASKAVYDVRDLRAIPAELRKFLLLGERNVAGFFTLEKEIRKRCKFFVNDLIGAQYPGAAQDYDIVFCRNVLIYFKPQDQKRIVTNLVKHLRPGGMLVLGHSETPDIAGLQIRPGQHSTFTKIRKRLGPKGAIEGEMTKPKVLVVDDSATMRSALEKLLAPRFELVLCDSAEAASKRVKEQNFDLISLDLNMPGENGLSWLTRMRADGLTTPVVIVSESDPASAEKLFGASAVNAQEYLTKSRVSHDPDSVIELFYSLGAKSLPGDDSQITARAFFAKNFRPKLIAIGASTGGPEALGKLLSSFPKPCPPIVVVQHMATEFARAFAQRLSATSGLPLAEFNGEAELLRNQIYLALNDVHLEVRSLGDQVVVYERDAAKEAGHRPSVNRLFKSLARANVDSIAILMTGMGEDGAEAMLDLAESKRCYTMVQDQKSSVVFGMNRRAIELKAACFVGSIEGLRGELGKRMKGW